MRNKYIRFFISSTFDDMKIERNLLMEIFSDLNAEYSEQNWQIDYIDLRWGISKETGLENKTMQVCKDELKQCQQMSPKPNFIILLGNRYGWIPLPEVVPVEIYETLQMTRYEKFVFDNWYKLDKNYLPNGAYIIKSRLCSKDIEYDIFSDKTTFINYANDNIWKEKVERELVAMLKRNNCKLYGTSATEQEIELGALNVDDAQEHVIAYIRHLQRIPDKKKKIYDESDKKDEISSLERRLREKLSDCNIISVDTDYDYYISSEYATVFKTEMKKHLCRIINNVIEESKQEKASSENQRHIDYALLEASEFIGREKELEYIKKYVENKEADYGLWYQAPSGMGKSALLAKVVEIYREDYDIICRFCGTSELSYDAESLFSSIYMDLFCLNSKNKGRKCDYINNRSFLNYQISYFSSTLKNGSFLRPLLIVIDSLDRVDDYNWPDFSTLQWLNANGRKDIRIIISSTPDLKYRIELPFIRKRHLDNLGDEAISLVYKQLHHKNRTLDESQKLQLSTIIEKSDKSPLYLKTLGRILTKVDSQQDISLIPHTLDGLIKYYCQQLSSASRHGQAIVDHIVFWLATAYSGIVENEIAETLSLNEVYLKYLIAESYQELDIRDGRVVIPPILWIRLRYDLQPLIRQENRLKIQLTTFFHPRIKQTILEIFKDREGYKKYLYTLLYHYYTSKYHDRHALLEGAHYLFHAYRNSIVTKDELMHHMESNLEFIVYKKLYFPKQLMEDYDVAISFIKEQETRRRLRLIKEQIHSIESCYKPKDIKMALRNMPLSSPLRTAMEQENDVLEYMEDTLAYTPSEESLYIIGGIGKSPVMSYNGKVVASLKDNCYRIELGYIEEPNMNYSWSFRTPLIEIQMDDEAHYIAAKTENTCFLLDLNKKSVIYKQAIDKGGWISLAGNGCNLLIGSHTCSLIQYDILENKQLVYNNILHAKLSPSGRYMWYIYKNDYSLNRFDFNEKKSISFSILPVKQYGASSLIKKDELCIVSCSEECCIAGNVFARHFINGEGKDKCDLFAIPEAPHLPMQHPSMFVHRNLPMWINSTGECIYINEKNILHRIGNINLEDLQCMNGDFTIALSKTQERIFYFLKEIQKFRCIKNDSILNITGINISASNCGSQIAVSSYGGHGHLGETNLFILRASNGKAYSWSPISRENDNYMSLPANAISPDGKILAVAVFPSNEIFIVDTGSNNVKYKYKLTHNLSYDDNIGRMKFSQDAEYLVALTGKYISPVDGPGQGVFIYEIKKNKCIKYITEYDSDNDQIWIDYDDVNLSSCNRYLFLDDSIYDIIEDRFLVKGDALHKHYKTISPSTPDVYAGGNHYNLYTQEQRNIEQNEYLLAISPSGLYHYHIRNFKLYVRKLQDDGEARFLRDHVIKVYPTLDDRHIYIIDIHSHYILFDTVEKKDLQTATKGTVENTGHIGIKICAQGLIVSNSNISTLSLYEPDKRFKVNKPAFTTFVRRWDLTRKIMKEPAALCPACGKLINYKNFNSIMLKEYAQDKVDVSDWDDPKLKNHRCPHCKAELQFTPYII